MDPEDIRDRWSTDGFVVLDGYLTVEELAPSIASLPSAFPTADEFHDDVDPVRNARFRDEFGGIDTFPFGDVELGLLAVHPSLIRLARLLLSTDDIRVYSIESWAKYTGAADYEQALHRDYLNHTLLVPSADAEFSQVEMFVYLSDVPDDLGAPSFVPLRNTTDLPVLPNWYPPSGTAGDDSGWTSRHAHPELYEHERSGAGSIGTVVAYTTSTFHRGRQLTRARGARYTVHVNFRPAHLEWAARRSWVDESTAPAWSDFVGRASPDQLALFGIPLPGHPYWTRRTLEGIAQRYPGLDVAPWRDALQSPPPGASMGVGPMR